MRADMRLVTSRPTDYVAELRASRDQQHRADRRAALRFIAAIVALGILINVVGLLAWVRA